VLAAEGIEKWAKELLKFSVRLLGKVGAAFYIRYSVIIGR